MKDIKSVDDCNASAAVAAACQRDLLILWILGYQYDLKVKNQERR